jgi:alpha-galactosidase
MGWSSWSSTWTGRPAANEAYFKAQADVMAARLKSSGFVYINMDSGWDQGFDEHGLPIPNLRKFPDGIAALAAYVHGKGLKFGIYLEPGLRIGVWQANGTIAGTDIHFQDIADITQQGSTQGKGNERAYRIDYSKPGAKEYIQSYVDLLASWGVDYIKMDFVGPGGGNVKADNREDLRQWHIALKKNGRPIWVELSNYLSIENVAVWQATSNGWRIESDIESYNRTGKVMLTRWSKVLDRFKDAPKWASYAGPGGWNDLDSLEIGNGDSDGLTPDERRTVMTLWSISCSPLILGADLTKLDDGDLAILTNPEVLAVDQAGHPATPLTPAGDQQIWRAKNPDGSYAVALFNLGKSDAKISLQWSDLGLTGPASVRDLWAHHDLGKFDLGYEATLATHASQLLQIKP